MLTAFLTLISLGTATIWDLRTRKIPNVLTFTCILIGIGVNTFSMGIKGMTTSMSGVFVGLLLMLLPFILGGMGAGDVKLLAAVGALNGTDFVIDTFLFGAIAGGVIALLIVFIKRKLYETVLNTLTLLKSGFRETHPAGLSQIKFPYGIAILVGATAAYILR